MDLPIFDMGSKFFPFRVGPFFQEGSKIILKELSLPESVIKSPSKGFEKFEENSLHLKRSQKTLCKCDGKMVSSSRQCLYFFFNFCSKLLSSEENNNPNKLLVEENDSSLLASYSFQTHHSFIKKCMDGQVVRAPDLDHKVLV